MNEGAAKAERRMGGVKHSELRRIQSQRNGKRAGKKALVMSARVFGPGLARRVQRRREALGITNLLDQWRVFVRNWGAAAMMHSAKEMGHREGHLVGYDNGFAAGHRKAAEESAPVLQKYLEEAQQAEDKGFAAGLEQGATCPTASTTTPDSPSDGAPAPSLGSSAVDAGSSS